MGHSGHPASSPARVLLSAAAFCLPFLSLNYATANDATAPMALQDQAGATTTYASRQSADTQAKLIPLRRQPVAGSAITFSQAPRQQLPQLSAAQEDASPILQGVRQQITSRAQNALTPGGLAATLEQGSSKGVQGTVADAGASLAQQAVDTGLRQLESRLSQRFFRTVNLNWSPGFNGREEMYQLDSVMSFYDGERGALLSQLGVQGRDGEVGTNVGMMLRNRGFEQMTFGLNAFYDYLSEPEVDRWSVGAEALGRWFSFSGNIYTGLSEDTTANGVSYSPDGWDVEVAGVMPAFPWVELSGRHYHWDRQGQDDLKGQDYKLTLKPVPMIGMSFRYDDSSGSAGGGSDIGVEFNLSYRIGHSLTEQLQALKEPNVGTDPWERRFERVRREYEQRVQRRGATATTSSITVASPTCSASSCVITLSNVQVPAGATSVKVSLPQALAPSLGTASGNSLLRNVRNCELENGPHGSSCDFDGVGVITVNLANLGVGVAAPHQFTLTFRNAAGTAAAPAVPVTVTVPARTAGAPGVSYSTLTLTVNEGGTATYTVVLDSLPTGAVTITPTSSDTSAATVSPATLSFTATTWSTPQTVTVTGQEDADMDSETLEITYAASGGGYDSLTPAAQTVTVSDNDGTRRVISSQATAITLTEGGGLASYNLSLSAAPSADVTIGLTSSDPGAITVSPASMTFTASTFGDAQQVTVTPVDDDDAANETASVSYSVSGGDYDGVTLAAQQVTVTDDEASSRGITSTAAASVTVNEGGTATYTLVLATQPTATVTIGLTSDDAAAVTVAPASLTFTTGNWNTAQTVTLTGEEDAGGAAETVMISYTVSGGDYQGVTLTPQTVTTMDNDVPGLTYSGLAPPSVTEGDDAEYDVVLNTDPTAGVTVTVVITSGTPAQLMVAPQGMTLGSSATLTFTGGDSGNWDMPQIVTVDSPADSVMGASAMVSLSYAVTSTDTSPGGYDGLTVTDQTVTVTGVTLTVTGFSAAGGNAQATLSWTNPASFASVTISTTGGTTPVADLTVQSTATPNNRATIGGLSNNNISYTFSITATDALGNTSVAATTTATPRDPNAPGITITTSPTNNTLSENSGTVVITATLNNPDHSSVMGAVTLTVERASGAAGGTAAAGDFMLSDSDTITAPGTLTLDATTSTGTVTVTGVDNDIDAADKTLSLTLSAMDSANAIPVDMTALNLTIADDDTSGVTSDPATTIPVDEGDVAIYTVVLDTEPAANVMVEITSGTPAQLTVAGPSMTQGETTTLTFTTANWDTPQMVTMVSLAGSVTGASATVSLSYAVTSTDASYHNLPATAPSVNVTGVTVPAPTAPTTPGTSTATAGAGQVALAWTNPTNGAEVRIRATTSSGQVDISTRTLNTATDCTVAGATCDLPILGTPTSATIMGLTNGTAYTFSIYALDANGNESTAALTATATPMAPGVTSTPTTITIGEGATTTVMLALSTQPTAAVTLTVAPSGANATLLTVDSGGTLNFTTSNWNTPQPVTISNAANSVGTNTDSELTYTASGGDYNNMAFNQAVTVTAATVPMVTGFSATPGNEQVTLSWTATPSGVASVVISAIDGALRTLDISDGSLDTTPDTTTDLTVAAPTATTTITGLVNNSTYRFNIVARDSLGNDSAEATDTATPVDPNAPRISITTNRTTLTEGGDTVTISATLHNAPSGDTTLTVAHNSGSATLCTTNCNDPDMADGDYILSTTMLTLNATDTELDITVTASNDDIDEDNESLTLQITAVDATNTSVPVDRVALSLTVADDDDTAGLTLDPAGAITVAEGGNATTVTLTLNSQPTARVTVTVAPTGANSDRLTVDNVASADIHIDPAGWSTGEFVFIRSPVNSVNSDTTATLTYTFTSTDPKYNNLMMTTQQVMITDVTVSPPTGFTATPGAGQVTLTWTNPTADGVVARVIVSATTGGNPISIGGSTGCSFASGNNCVLNLISNLGMQHTVTVTGLAAAAHNFRIVAVDAVGNESTALTDMATPTAVLRVMNFTATAGDGQVSLSWTNATGSTGVRISAVDASNAAVNISGGTNCTVDGNNCVLTITSGMPTSHTVTSLTNGTQYTFSIYAQHTGGVESAAETAMATPVPSAFLYIGDRTNTGADRDLQEGSSTRRTIGVALSSAAPTGGITVTLNRSFASLGTADDFDESSALGGSGNTGRTLTVAAGDDSAEFTVGIVDDDIYEGQLANPTVSYTLVAGTGYSLHATRRKIVSVIQRASGSTSGDNESPPEVSIAVTPTTPIAENGGQATVTVSLNRASKISIRVGLTRSGTADIGAGMDYTATGTGFAVTTSPGDPSYTLTTSQSSAGSMSASFTVTAVDDSADDDNETAIFTISSCADIFTVACSTSATANSVTITIADDDTP